ncbi:four helix bundle protein [Mucilaginibacter sp. ZB1P21]|uniref:Four helix bundle protein n=2 Tax=Mucilaginibacter glaciei TaxID=2772109 RepID=A0A926NTB2_9SPHI|nr:four helix bundle protein [Mucilaginibacter glaciei]
MKSFEDLEVWKQCRDYRISINDLLKQFPSDEKFRLVDQLKRCSRSVTANIAEGHGRYHYGDNIKFCRNARGSLNETLDHLICAHDENIITQDKLNEFRLSYENCFRLLNGYIAYLKT